MAYRLALVALAASFAWGGFRHLGRHGPVARLCWLGDGRWRLDDAGGRTTYVEPLAPRRLGMLLWLSWREVPGGRYFHADGASVEPKALPALKARMKLAGPRSISASTAAIQRGVSDSGRRRSTP